MDVSLIIIGFVFTDRSGNQTLERTRRGILIDQPAEDITVQTVDQPAAPALVKPNPDRAAILRHRVHPSGQPPAIRVNEANFGSSLSNAGHGTGLGTDLVVLLLRRLITYFSLPLYVAGSVESLVNRANVSSVKNPGEPPINILWTKTVIFGSRACRDGFARDATDASQPGRPPE